MSIPDTGRQRIGLMLVLVGHAALALLYAWMVPAWEAPDEPAHYRRVRSLSSTAGAEPKVLGRQAVWQLQPAQPGEKPAACPSASSSDLTASRPALWERDSLLLSYEQYQPRLGHLVWVPWFLLTGPAHPPVFVNPDYPDGGQSVFLHDLDGDPAMMRSLRKLRTLRSFGALLGLLTVLGVWRCGRLVAPRQPGVALAAAAAAGFLPQFTFVAGYVNNDLPAAAAGVWLTALVLQRLVPGRRVTGAWIAGITILLWVAVACRPNAAGLAVLVLLALLALVGRQYGRRMSVALGAGLAVAALGALWALRTFSPSFWFTWSGHFEGRLLGGNALTPLAGFLGISRSLVGVFGWMDVALPPLTYAIAGLLTLVLLGSVMVQLLRPVLPRVRTVAGILAAGFLGVGVPAFLNALSRGQAQGRYLFPALGILAVLAGLGACGTFAARTGWRLASLLAVMLFAANVTAVTGVLVPAYSGERPSRLTRMDTPAGPLLVQHDPPRGAPDLPPDRKGRWVLAAPEGRPLSLPLSLRLFRRSTQPLLDDTRAAGRMDPPADLPGVSGVTSHGPGNSPAARVRPVFMTAGQVRRQVLLAHSTSRVVLDPVQIPAGALAAVTLGMDDRVRDHPGDGVTFRLLLRTGDSDELLLLERHLDPRVRQSDAGWLSEEVDLGALAGAQGSFILETLPGPAGDTGHDWAGWAGLDLVVPRRPVPAGLCHVGEGRALNQDALMLNLPAGGNITLRLADPPAGDAGIRLELLPQPSSAAP